VVLAPGLVASPAWNPGPGPARERLPRDCEIALGRLHTVIMSRRLESEQLDRSGAWQGGPWLAHWLGTGQPSPATGEARAASGRDLGLLLLRVTIGVIMFGHGTQKLFGWFGGQGLGVVGPSFSQLGYPAGRLFAAIAGLTEALGGAGLALGLLTPLAGAAILGAMINAMAVVWHGSLYGDNGIEYEVLLALTGASLALTGAGRYSLDHYLFDRYPLDRYLGGLQEPRRRVGVAAIVLGLVLAAIVLLIRG